MDPRAFVLSISNYKACFILFNSGFFSKRRLDVALSWNYRAKSEHRTHYYLIFQVKFANPYTASRFRYTSIYKDGNVFNIRTRSENMDRVHNWYYLIVGFLLLITLPLFFNPFFSCGWIYYCPQICCGRSIYTYFISTHRQYIISLRVRVSETSDIFLSFHVFRAITTIWNCGCELTRRDFQSYCQLPWRHLIDWPSNN